MTTIFFSLFISFFEYLVDPGLLMVTASNTTVSWFVNDRFLLNCVSGYEVMQGDERIHLGRDARNI